MGQEIGRSHFGPADFAGFARRLQDETRLFAQLERGQRLSQRCCTIGFEVEGWLVRSDLLPAPINTEYLAALDDPLVVPELSRFNVELNGTPQPLRGAAFSRLETELTHTWRRCLEVAQRMDSALVLIGILPTIRESDLTMRNVSPLRRYEALNEQVLRLRRGRPLTVDIRRTEHLHTTHGDVMLEAATTSFQVHLQVPAARAARLYNAALIASAPVLAAGVNSPFLFGRCLWAETRIPLFEQSVAAHEPGASRAWRRVSFGRGYVAGGLAALFEENQARFPVLLPMLSDDPADRLAHLRLHNGTIWRWNRPLIGFDDDGTPHLRIEHRSLPAGPSIVDMIANAAFFTGVAAALHAREPPPEPGLRFEQARANFYAAARDGLDATIDWTGTPAVDVRSLILEELLTLASDGLDALGVDGADIAHYLGVIERRVRRRRTGAAWQCAYVERFGRDSRALTAAYLANQLSGAPVHEWPL
ncbi:MAG: hypothetical protein NHB36_00095 [Nitrospira sp.]|nr:hypothetical protein [Nitrospira sp.]